MLEDEGLFADHTSGVSATDGRWHHIAVTWRSKDGIVKLYDNGREVGNDVCRVVVVGWGGGAWGMDVVATKPQSLGTAAACTACVFLSIHSPRRSLNRRPVPMAREQQLFLYIFIHSSALHPVAPALLPTGVLVSGRVPLQQCLGPSEELLLQLQLRSALPLHRCGRWSVPRASASPLEAPWWLGESRLVICFILTASTEIDGSMDALCLHAHLFLFIRSSCLISSDNEILWSSAARFSLVSLLSMPPCAPPWLQDCEGGCFDSARGGWV